MNQVIDWFMYYMKYQPNFLCKRNNPDWGLEEIKKDSDTFGAYRHMAVHSDAGKDETAQGTSCFFAAGYADSEKYANSIYKAVAPLSPGKDRGVHPDTDLYSTGLGELRGVKATACLIELGFHTNPADADDIMNRTRIYGKELARANVMDCGENFMDPDVTEDPKEYKIVVVPSGPADVGAALILSRALQVRMAYRGDIKDDEKALQVGGGDEVQTGCLKIIGDDFIDTADKVIQYAKAWGRI
jgi:hypothetical protein